MENFYYIVVLSVIITYLLFLSVIYLMTMSVNQTEYRRMV